MVRRHYPTFAPENRSILLTWDFLGKQTGHLWENKKGKRALSLFFLSGPTIVEKLGIGHATNALALASSGFGFMIK
jgi:hypothetical protein